MLNGMEQKPAEQGVTRFVHPFAEPYRAVLKEKYPDIEAAIPAGTLPDLNDMPEDVLTESLDRYSDGEGLFIGPRAWVEPSADTAKEQKIKPVITYA
jgi:hypothetical protein